ncbi:MAG: 1-deoxy-D-xylulose-5-phosphate reductoisomerase [Clostridia bacterium]|nr:1-deoxy-D-xylulose-5-phosphate reductoisomerase [Bacillota bacterium]MDA8211954.1 1-deoxy-D-xylulose-5-phosphate reductoisomerase [Clostridia bacterium]
MTKPKRISIIGSTGSIGKQTLEIARALPGKVQVVGLAAGANVELLAEQAREFRPPVVCIKDESLVRELKDALGDTNTEIVTGLQGLITVATMAEADMVVTSVTGSIGLVPTLEAIKLGKQIALANKETLVAAGELVMNLAKEKGSAVIPVDSEHSAVFQSLQGNRQEDVHKLILTASGGPFRGWSAGDLAKVTLAMALKHPNWSMGQKITVDSATLMNKGLEVIEARWLFALEFPQIEVVVHPQSIIHSMVEYIDGSVIAQLGVPDMKVPIQYALSYPARWAAPWSRLNWTQIREFTFEQPDLDTFSCLKYAYEAGKTGGTMPAVLNAANEEAVALFLQEAINFTEIPQLIARAMDKHTVIARPGLEEILSADNWARNQVKRLVTKG